MYQIERSAIIKLFILIAILTVGGFLAVYFLTIQQVNQKYKNQQSSGGSVPVSTSDLSKDYVSLKGGNPQAGAINVSGDISANNVQGSTITSTVQNGTSPFNVTSSTLVNNLNADMVDGKHADDLSKPNNNITQQNINNITNTTTGETIQPGTSSDYYRGDKTWQTLNSSAVGLGNVENTALSTWTGSNTVAILGTVTSGTWNAGSINAAGSITGTALQGTSLNLGSGTITSGTINGQTISSSANFTGTITAAGAINGATISGGTLSGGNISGGTVQGGTLSSTAVNGVTTANILVNTGTYSDPSWLQSLAGSKITGDISGNASGLTGTPNITVGTISSGNITSSGTLNITGTGNSNIGGNININPDFGSELTTNGSFNGNANNWLVSCTDPNCSIADTPNSVPASGWSYGTNSVSHASGANNTDTLYQDLSNTTGETYGTPVVNENFNSNPSATWGAGWTWTGSAMRHDSGQTAYLWGGFTATPGWVYKISFTTSNMTPGTKLAAYFGNNAQKVNFTGNGRHTFYTVAGAAWSGSVYLGFTYSSVPGTVTLDDIYVVPVTGAAYLENSLQPYKVTFTVSNMTAGSLGVNLGGESGTPVTANGTYTQYLMAAPNANFVAFTPSPVI